MSPFLRSLTSAVWNLTRWTAEYEAQRKRHPSVVMGIFIAVDDECAQTVKEVDRWNGTVQKQTLVSHSVRISGLLFRQLISQVIQRDVLQQSREAEMITGESNTGRSCVEFSSVKRQICTHLIFLVNDDKMFLHVYFHLKFDANIVSIVTGIHFSICSDRKMECDSYVWWLHCFSPQTWTFAVFPSGLVPVHTRGEYLTMNRITAI